LIPNINLIYDSLDSYFARQDGGQGRIYITANDSNFCKTDKICQELADVLTRVMVALKPGDDQKRSMLLKTVPLYDFTELAQPNMTAVKGHLDIKRKLDAWRGAKHAPGR